MGDTDEQISHSLKLLEHIKGFGQNFTQMAKVCDWEVDENGTLMSLFEFIENTADKLPTIPEMIHISNLSFLASKQYDHTGVREFVDFHKTVLFEITRNGIEGYSGKYFLPHVNDEACETLDWLTNLAYYFIKDDEFKNEYLACVGFVHRDIHRHNIIINKGLPYLIDCDFSGIDCRLIKIPDQQMCILKSKIFYQCTGDLKM
jgi:hypothetical protein